MLRSIIRLRLSRNLLVFGGMGKFKYYAVALGKSPGIYVNWDDCKDQITGFHGARFKGFDDEAEAREFVITKKARKVTDGSAGPSKPSMKGARAAAQPYAKNAASGQKRLVSTKSADSKDDDSDDDDDAYTTVYTDGACPSNGYKNAMAGIGVFWGNNHKLNVSEALPGRATNNRAEIHAACKALEQAKANKITHLKIKTDSHFMISAMTDWLDGWKKKDWKRADGSAVKNREDFEKLDKLCKGVKVKWEHVRAHRGDYGNEQADKLAVAGAGKVQ